MSTAAKDPKVSTKQSPKKQGGAKQSSTDGMNAGDKLEYYPTLTSYIMRQEMRVATLMEFSGWTRPWVEHLWAFCSSFIDDGAEEIKRNDFCQYMMDFFGLNAGLIVDRTFHVTRRMSPDHRLTPEAFFKGLCIILTGSFNQQVNYVFDIYDMNFDGMISFEELTRSLRDSLMDEDFEAKEEGIREIVEIVQKFLKVSKDASIKREEFNQSVHQNTLLLEILGQCLPDQSHRERFFEFINPKRTTFAQMQRIMRKQINAMSGHYKTKVQKKNFYPFLLVPPIKKELRGICSPLKCTRMMYQ